MKKRGMWLMGILLLAAVLLTVGIRLSLGGKEAKKEVERRSLGERLAEADQWRKQRAEGTETKEPEEGVTVLKWAFTEIGQESVEPYETALNAALEEKGLSWRVSFTGMEGPKTNGMANPLFYKDQVEEGDYDIISCMDTGYVSLYGMLAREGQVEEKMMYNTYNMGIGMVLAVDAQDASQAMEAIRAAGEIPYLIGRIEDGEKGVTLC